MASTPITQADVLSFAPALSSLTDQAMADVVAYVNDDVNLDSAGEDPQTTRMARILLACHLGTMIQRGGSGVAGPVTSSAAGGVRRSYGMTTLSLDGVANALSTTTYGQQFAFIVGTSLAALPFVV